MSELLIIEDFLPKSYQNDLEQVLIAWGFPWTYQANTDFITKDNQAEYELIFDSRAVPTQQFIHMFQHFQTGPSQHYSLIHGMKYFIEEQTNLQVESFLRAKANLLIKDSGFPTDGYHQPHIDLGFYQERDFKSLVYYVNDSDGDTFFFSTTPGDHTVTQRVSPKKGTAILFDRDIYHASSSPKLADNRLVINLNILYN
jgi:hypothetical protein